MKISQHMYHAPFFGYVVKHVGRVRAGCAVTYFHLVELIVVERSVAPRAVPGRDRWCDKSVYLWHATS